MGYVKIDNSGKRYIETKTGIKYYVRNTPPFQPIDYSKPKVQQPGLASINPVQVALNNAIKNNNS